MANDSERDGKNGGKLKTGNAGNKGGSGAVPSQLRDWCKMLCEDGSLRDELIACLGDRTNRNYAAMWRLVFAYAHGLPKQDIAVSKTAQIVHTVSLPPLGAAFPQTVPLSHPGKPLALPESTETEETEAVDYTILPPESP